MTKRLKYLILMLLGILICILYIFILRYSYVRSHLHFHQEEYNKSVNLVLSSMDTECGQLAYDWGTFNEKIKNPINGTINVRCDNYEGKTHIFFPKSWNEGAGSGEGSAFGLMWSSEKPDRMSFGPGKYFKFIQLKDHWYIFNA